MKIKGKLLENKKVLVEGEGLEGLRKIDDYLKRM